MRGPDRLPGIVEERVSRLCQSQTHAQRSSTRRNVDWHGRSYGYCRAARPDGAQAYAGPVNIRA